MRGASVCVSDSVSHQHLQCSWVWAGTFGHALSRETGPPSRRRPAAPQCCRPCPGSACAFAPLECGWCSAPHHGTETPSPSYHWDQHLEIEHTHKSFAMNICIWDKRNHGIKIGTHCVLQSTYIYIFVIKIYIYSDSFANLVCVSYSLPAQHSGD